LSFAKYSFSHFIRNRLQLTKPRHILALLYIRRLGEAYECLSNVFVADTHCEYRHDILLQSMRSLDYQVK